MDESIARNSSFALEGAAGVREPAALVVVTVILVVIAVVVIVDVVVAGAVEPDRAFRGLITWTVGPVLECLPVGGDHLGVTGDHEVTVRIAGQVAVHGLQADALMLLNQMSR